ncbi:hypothetical protein [Streptomyces acidiscabies]|uniref:hypothetical protein n=1 Tax=Streptomyces acidiscabies TaxID=42234 RepID=UPI0009510A98|nr:hypothetical protein [Streptomyces acidiscabies]
MTAADNEAFIHDRLAHWERHLRNTIAAAPAPGTGRPLLVLGPLLDQLVALRNLTSGLVEDLRRDADSPPLTASAPGRDYLTRLAGALARTAGAAAHLSTAVTALTESHQHAHHPDAPGLPAEQYLTVRLAHAAALRSLGRALDTVTRPPADPAACPAPAPVGEHVRTADAPPTQPARRRP